MKKKKLYILIAFFLINNLYAQEKYLYNNIPVCFNLDSLESIAQQQSKQPKLLLKTLIILEKSRARYTSYKAGKSCKQIDSLATTLYDNLAKAYGYIFKARVFITGQTKLDSAFLLSNKALAILENTKDTTAIFFCLGELIDINFIIKNDNTLSSKSLQQNKASIAELLKKMKAIYQKYNKPFIAVFYNTYLFQYAAYIEEDMKKCKELIQSSLNIIEANPDCNHFKTYFLSNLGYFKFLEGKHKEVLEIFKQLNAFPEHYTSLNFGIYDFRLADSYLELKQYDSANFYANRALNKTNSLKLDLGFLADTYQLLAKLKYAQHDYTTAWHFRNTADSISQVKTEQGRQKQFNDLQEKYRANEKELQNKLLINKNNQFKSAIIGGSILLMLLGVVIWYIYKQNIKITQFSVFRDKIHSIISHDFRSPITSLNNFASSAAYLIKNNKADQLQKVAQQLQTNSLELTNLLNNLLFWASSIKSNNKFVSNTFNLSNSIKQIEVLYADKIEQKNVHIIKSFNDTFNITAHQNTVELALRNWIDNTLKYTNATEININAVEQTNVLTISVTSNTRLTIEDAKLIQQQLNTPTNIQSETSTGLGLGLISFFAKKQNWKLQFQNNETSNVFSIGINK